MARVRRLALTDFRCYRSAELEPAPTTTLVVGGNGEGKTTLLEAIAWAATGRSFRGVPDAALVRDGADAAILRCEVDDDGRWRVLAAELHAHGRNRVLVDDHTLARVRDRHDLLRVTVFAPDDLALVKGGPSQRRHYLDELLVACAPRYEAVRAEVDRVLRHRNALLRGGLRGPDATSTLEVFDEQLARAGGELVDGRLRLVARLAPSVRDAYRALAEDVIDVEAAYEAAWVDGPVPTTREELVAALRAALVAGRRRELERGVTLAGPHRDEWHLRLAGREARTHASQGEQRTLALSMRLGGHRVCAATVGAEPVLLLDDVFSELDVHRAAALVANLPDAQTILTTAGVVPDAVRPAMTVSVAGGRLVEAA